MVYIQMHVAGCGGGGQIVKFVLCAGSTQSLHFSCADTAYVGMQGMESTRGNLFSPHKLNFTVWGGGGARVN